MSNSIVIKYTLGEEDVYHYLFSIHIYQIPGSENKIATIVLLSTNTMYLDKSFVDQYLEDLILFLANLVIKYNANYDPLHNQLNPYSYEESENIAELVNNKANEIRQSLISTYTD